MKKENNNVIVKKQAIVKQSCHSRSSSRRVSVRDISGIYNACRNYKKEKTLLNKCVEDPRLQPSGMTPLLITTRGFTLIELLVVVLIIGILAAVAVPQYKLAVVKADTVRIIPLIHAIANANQTYYLANGSYTANVNKLDISLPAECTNLTESGLGIGQVWKCKKNWVIDNSSGQHVMAYYCPNSNSNYNSCYENSDFKAVITINLSGTGKREAYCRIQNNSKLGKQICSKLTGFSCSNC